MYHFIIGACTYTQNTYTHDTHNICTQKHSTHTHTNTYTNTYMYMYICAMHVYTLHMFWQIFAKFSNNNVKCSVHSNLATIAYPSSNILLCTAFTESMRITFKAPKEPSHKTTCKITLSQLHFSFPKVVRSTVPGAS